VKPFYRVRHGHHPMGATLALQGSKRGTAPRAIIEPGRPPGTVARIKTEWKRITPMDRLCRRGDPPERAAPDFGGWPAAGNHASFAHHQIEGVILDLRDKLT